MHPLIKEVIEIIRTKYPGYSSLDIERILDSEFIVLEKHIRAKDIRSVNMINLGKFRFSKYFLNKQNELAKETTGNIPGVEK